MSELGIRFTGNQIQPGRVSAKHLADVLRAYEDVIADLVTNHSPEISKDLIVVGLSEITHQSVGLQFEANVPELTLPAATQLTEAIQQLRFDMLPETARKFFITVRNFTRRYGCTAEIQAQGQLATIDETSEIATPPKLTGFTTVYGTVQRVGGDEPRVRLQMFTGESVYCTTTVDMAKEIGDHLYEDVGLEGTATWDYESLKIEEFKVDRLLPYGSTSAALAFRELRSEFSEIFDSIDPDEFVAEIRGGDEPDLY